MREAQFLKQNAEKWKQYEAEVKRNASADVLADRFVELTDDLAYAKTFYAGSNTAKYLNGLASLFHQQIYKNKKEKGSRVLGFWMYELPYLFGFYQKQFAYALVFFLIFCSMGALSAAYDENFIRLILGDNYVNMTNENIENDDPFGVYKSASQMNMFVQIGFNNIRVAFIAYVLGITFSVGTVWLLLSNGLMLGSFEYFFFAKGLGFKSITVVLSLIYFYNVLLVLLGVLTFTDLFYLELFVASLFVKTVIELSFLFPVANFYKEKKLLWWFPIMQPFHILYMVIAGWLGKFGSYQWKGRSVK